jgi:hypothetical protein
MKTPKTDEIIVLSRDDMKVVASRKSESQPAMILMVLQSVSLRTALSLRCIRAYQSTTSR